jgi:hypothetical protein
MAVLLWRFRDRTWLLGGSLWPLVQCPMRPEHHGPAAPGGASLGLSLRHDSLDGVSLPSYLGDAGAVEGREIS